MTIAIRHACAGLLLCAGLLAAGETPGILDDTITANLWRCRPGELLAELNLHLPPHRRFAWYVAHDCDTSIYPGPDITARNQTLRAVLDGYCQQTGLAWVERDRCLWIYRPVAADVAAGRAPAILAADAAARQPAMGAVLAHPDPLGLRQLLGALASPDAAVRQDARRFLTLVLGARETSLANPRQLVIDIFSGNLPHLAQPRAMISEYGDRQVAPWAGMYIALHEETSRAAVRGAIRSLDAEALSRDLPLLTIGCLALLDEVGPALDLRRQRNTEGFGDWEGRWIMGRSQQVAKWIADRRGNVWPADRDYDAAARTLRASAIGGERLTTLLAEVAAADAEAERRQAELDALKEANAGKDQIRAAEARVKEARNQGDGPRKILDSRDRENKKVIDGLRDGFGLAAVMLAEIAAEQGTDLAVRMLAMNALDLHRNPAAVPMLVQICRHDPHPVMRTMAARVLGALGDDTAVAALCESLNDMTDLMNRQGGATGLALTRYPEAGAMLMRRLAACTGEENRKERENLLQYLGMCRDPAGDALLQEQAIHGTEPNDRTAAVLGLSFIPTPTAQAALVQIINDPGQDLSLRQAAVTSLTPQDSEQARRNLPIFLQALPKQTDVELALNMVDAIWKGSRYLTASTPLKAEVAEVCIAIFRDPATHTKIRTRMLNVFKNTDNSPAILTGLQQAHDAEKDKIFKGFIAIAIENVKRGLKAAGETVE
jgi:hypothetical protein